MQGIPPSFYPNPNPNPNQGVPPSFYFIFTMRATMVAPLLGRTPSAQELEEWRTKKLKDDPTAFGAVKRPQPKSASSLSVVTSKSGAAAAGGSPEGPSTAKRAGSKPGEVLWWAKDNGLLDEDKLLALSRRVITHFTQPYAKLQIGKKGQLKEGGTVSAPLAESCRLLREIDLPFACYCERQNARLIAAGGGEQSSEALHGAWDALPAAERAPFVEQAAALLHGDDALPRLQLTQPKITHAEAWASASDEVRDRYLARAASAWTDDYRRSVDVFDFSERKCMKCAAEVVTRVRGQPRTRGALLVLPVGDALQEPFWPEGLGVNRGCHNALDAAWVANKWGLGGASEESQRLLLQERQYIYQEFSLQMHGKNRKMLKGYRQDNTKARLVAPPRRDLPRSCEPPPPATPPPHTPPPLAPLLPPHPPTPRRAQINSSAAHKEYSADPSSRYNNYHDRAQIDWARAARLGATKGHPNLTVSAPNPRGRWLTGGV